MQRIVKNLISFENELPGPTILRGPTIFRPENSGTCKRLLKRDWVFGGFLKIRMCWFFDRGEIGFLMALREVTFASARANVTSNVEVRMIL